MSLLKILASVLIPPLGVYLERGIGKSLVINLILTFLGIVPGIVHALWCINDDKQSFGLDRLIRKK